jgi:ADP-dependent NAD(P)H-hydrate dehydratase
VATDAEPLTPQLLRGWPLPEPTGSKDARGAVLVVGGARGTPGAVLLAGEAALRVGAGRLTLAVAASVAGPAAVGFPESGVVGLPESAAGSVTGPGDGELDGELRRSDVVLVGAGLDEPDGTAALLRALAEKLPRETPVVVDAFALGVLRDSDARAAFEGRAVLTPNDREAARLLAVDEAPPDAARRIAAEFAAVVAFEGTVAAPDGRTWRSTTGYSGLGTSGSGDVLAGAVAGAVATGADLAQATCWAVALHALAGDRLAADVGPRGFLARELVGALPAAVLELRAR